MCNTRGHVFEVTVRDGTFTAIGLVDIHLEEVEKEYLSHKEVQRLEKHAHHF